MPDYDFSALGAQYNNEYLNNIYRGLLERGYGQRQAASMLSKIMQDTGGDPYYSSGDGKRSGIMGWGEKEYRINPFMETNPKRELNRQLDYIVRNVAASDGEDELDEYGTKVYDIVSTPMVNTYEGGGGVIERRRSGDADVSLEGYKQAKRDSIINAAVNKAIARTHGVTPMINGEPGESCLYTATDNYGRQYRVAGNQTFLANPQNYGFEVNGPVENTRVGDLYQMFDYKADNRLLPSHMSIITGYDENGEPLVTYSRGDAYEDIYGDDYQKNARVWEMPAYETYRFVGTPSDNARWENEFMALPLVEPIPKINHPETQSNVYGDGGGALRTALRNIDSTLKAYEDPRNSRQPVHIEPTRRSDFSGFRGGHFGGAGAGYLGLEMLPEREQTNEQQGNWQKYNGMSKGGILLRNYYADGGKTVSDVWEERTGTSWKDVGKYYDKYDKSAKNNLELLRQLNEGKWDYLNGEQKLIESSKSLPHTFNSPRELTKSQVADIQTFLKDNGYDIGPTGVDSIFGPRTTAAYQKYLMDSGVSVGSSGADGVFGKDTQLGSSALSEVANAKNKEAAVRNVENTLLTEVPKRPEVKKTEIVAEQPIAEQLRAFNEPSFVSSKDEVVVPNPQEGTGISNIGQLYNDKYDEFVTNNGLDLSNIKVSGDSLIPPQILASKYSGGMNYADLDSAVKDGKRITNDGTETRCSAFVQLAAIDNYGYDYQRTNGMNGDAWKIGDNMVAKGGQRYFNVFADGENGERPWMDYLYNQTGVKNVAGLKARYGSGDGQSSVGRKMFGWAKKEFDKGKQEYKTQIMDNVKEGDVVELMYNGSRHSVDSIADSKGSRPNTHAGYICKINGEYYIQDNVVGKVHTRKLSDVLENKANDIVLVGIVRPYTSRSEVEMDVSEKGRSATQLEDFGIYQTGQGDTKYYRLDNDVAYRAMGALHKNKEELASELQLTPQEFNMLAGVVHSIIFKESGMGESSNNQKFLNKKGAALKKQYEDAGDLVSPIKSAGYDLIRKATSGLNNITGGMMSEIDPSFEPSIGVSQLKFDGPNSLLTDSQRASLGEGGYEALVDVQPETSSIASMYATANNYKALIDAYEKYNVPDNWYDEDTIVGLLGKMYNEGPAIVIQTIANASREANNNQEQRNSLFDERLEKLQTNYSRGVKTLYGYHTYNLFSAEDADSYMERIGSQKDKSVDAIVDAIGDNIELMPTIMTLIRNMTVKDAKRFGAAASASEDNINAYRTGNLSIKPDSLRDVPATIAYRRAFKKGAE